MNARPDQPGTEFILYDKLGFDLAVTIVHGDRYGHPNMIEIWTEGNDRQKEFCLFLSAEKAKALAAILTGADAGQHHD